MIPPDATPLGPETHDRSLEFHTYKDDLDMQLLHPNTGDAAYIFRVPRNPGDEVFALHKGTKLDPIVAAVRFKGYFSGELSVGDSSQGIPWGVWEQPDTRAYTSFAIKVSGEERRYRWLKTTKTKRTGTIKMSAFDVWVLKDITDLPSTQAVSAQAVLSSKGDDVATLSLELDIENRPRLRDKILGRGSSNDEAGDTQKGVILFEQELQPSARDAAIALVLALCHRDRAITKEQGLGPNIGIKPPRHAKYIAGLAVGGLGGGAIYAAGPGFGGGAIASGGFSGGGGDCGGGGGGGGGC
ncbi:Hypothetical protein D9617_39g039140 [Elsinoe fawcettii]|nr:Hypothetical protein D9617_39g039140 [Elsinoe fawcettii]